MRAILLSLLSIAVSAFKLRQVLALENLALQQHLAVLKQFHRRSQLRRKDRFFWLGLSQAWGYWRQTPVIVKPETNELETEPIFQ